MKYKKHRLQELKVGLKDKK